MKLNYNVEHLNVPRSNSDILRELAQQFIESGADIAELIDDEKHYANSASFYSSAGQQVRRATKRKADLMRNGERIYIIRLRDK